MKGSFAPQRKVRKSASSGAGTMCRAPSPSCVRVLTTSSGVVTAAASAPPRLPATKLAPSTFARPEETH